MPDLNTIAIVVIVVFAARTLESVMGFGGAALGLPILAMLVPDLEIKSTLVPMLTIGGIVSAIGVVWVGRREIVWAEFLRIIVWMLPGLPIGFLAAGYASEAVLRLILGLFVVAVGVFSLARAKRQAADANPSGGRLRQWYLRAVVVASGVVHGIFATGGPVLVVYATRVLHSKGLFRVTLALVWFVLNVMMVGGWMVDNRIAPEAWPMAAITIPFIIISVLVGNRLHHRLPEAAFRKTAYVLLIVAGISLIHKSLPLLLQSPTM